MMTPEAFIESLTYRNHQGQLGQADTETLQAVHDVLSPRYVMHGYDLPEGVEPLYDLEVHVYRYTGYLIDERTKKPFWVNQWGSHPDAGNDDCWCGDGFDTETEARASLVSDFAQQGEDDEWLELVGPGVREVYHQKGWRKGPPQEETCTEWAMLQGMSHGIEAYNEAIGSPLETEWND